VKVRAGSVSRCDRRGRSTVRGASLVVLVFVLVACTAPAPEGTVALPRFEGDSVAMTGLIGGTLVADDSDEGCVWLEDGDGRALIVWAFPVYLRSSDLSLVDEDGNTLARVGDEVALGGGYAEPEDDLPCVPAETVVRAWDVGPPER
jgi:hypothetical protein